VALALHFSGIYFPLKLEYIIIIQYTSNLTAIYNNTHQEEEPMNNIIRTLSLVFIIVLPTILIAENKLQQRACKLEILPTLPDVKINSAIQEAQPTPHCKVAGVIGTETNFELLLPGQWNGKFVLGGGGGFVCAPSADMGPPDPIC
jgi:feruloyl esterase